MTNINNNKEIHVCGWCSVEVSDGMEFCSDECRDRCMDAYHEDMKLDQELYDAGREDACTYMNDNADMEMPVATCNACGTEHCAYDLTNSLCDTCVHHRGECS